MMKKIKKIPKTIYFNSTYIEEEKWMVFSENKRIEFLSKFGLGPSGHAHRYNVPTGWGKKIKKSYMESQQKNTSPIKISKENIKKQKSDRQNEIFSAILENKNSLKNLRSDHKQESNLVQMSNIDINIKLDKMTNKCQMSEIKIKNKISKIQVKYNININIYSYILDKTTQGEDKRKRDAGEVHPLMQNTKPKPQTPNQPPPRRPQPLPGQTPPAQMRSGSSQREKVPPPPSPPARRPR